MCVFQKFRSLSRDRSVGGNPRIVDELVLEGKLDFEEPLREEWFNCTLLHLATYPGRTSCFTAATQTSEGAAMTAATQTEKESPVPLLAGQVKASATERGIQTGRSGSDTPESGYESASGSVSGNGGEGSSVRTHTEAASRAVRHRTEPEQKEPPRLAPRAPKRGMGREAVEGVTPALKSGNKVPPGMSLKTNRRPSYWNGDPAHMCK